MNIDIRQAVIHNISSMSTDELKAMIQDSIDQREEKLLPGLGVIFEVIWTNSDTEEQQKMGELLHTQLGKNRNKS